MMRTRFGSLLVALATACSPGTDSRASLPEVTDSAGVRIVVNHGGDRPFGAEFQLVAQLIPPDSALTPVPWGIASDLATGRVFVADGDRVAVFAADGGWLKDFGRLGDGPGEFRNMVALTLDPYGAVAIWDTGRSVVSRWTSEGSLLNEQRAPINYWGPGMAVGPDWLAAVSATQSESSMAMEQRLTVLSGGDTTIVHAVTQSMSMMRLPCISSGGIPAPKVLAPSVTWAASGETLYFLVGPGYRLDTWVLGRKVGSIRRLVEPVEVTDELAVAAVEVGPGPYRGFMRRCATTPAEIARAVGHEELVPAVLNIAVDPRGRLWVTRTEHGIGPEIVDVLDAGGGYLGSFPFDGVVTAFLADSVFVSVDLDLEGTGETMASIYRMVPSGSAAPAPHQRVQALPEVRDDVSEFRDCPDCPTMVALPLLAFTMGSPMGEAPAASDPTRPEATERAERPQVPIAFEHRFAIGKYEVTFEEWDYCVEAGGCEYTPADDGWGRGRRPVTHVARRDAEQYIAWLGVMAGEPYRLPSEAEWEFAARGGTSTARWWGEHIGRAMAVCDGCGSQWDNHSTAPVGSFPPNPFGLYDMLSNVSEWVADCWHTTLDGQPLDGTARVESSGWWDGAVCERPAKRGGAWRHYPWTVRAAARTFYFPGNWTDRDASTTGFRVARTIEP